MRNKKQVKAIFKKAATIFIAANTILWSLGLPVSVLVPSAQAASGTNIMYQNDGGSCPDVFLDTSTSSELVLAIEAFESEGTGNKISSVTLTIRDTIGMEQSGQMTGFTNTDLEEIGLYLDADGNSAFDSGTDTVLATSSPGVWTLSATSTWYYAFSGLNVSIPTAYSYSNTNRILVTARPAAASLNTSPLKGFEFYLGTGAVAVSMDSGASLTNFPASPRSFPPVWLGTEGMGSMGTPFIISEVQAAGASSTDEFIEIYNRSPDPLDLNGFTVAFAASNTTSTIGTIYNWTGSSTLSNAAGTTTIPGNGFLLITHTGYDGAAAADQTYGGFDITPDGFVALLNASSGIMDLVGYGDVIYSSLAEGGSAVYPGPSANGSLERKAFPDSTPTKMVAGGVHASNGNGQDSQNNAMDFITQAVSNPQNSAAAAESPGGGFGAGMSEIVINEVFYNTATTSGWIEIYNRSGSIQNISGWLVAVNSTSTDANTYALPDNAATQNVPNGGYVIVYWNKTGTDSSASSTLVQFYTGAKNPMSTIAGDVVVYISNGTIKDYVQYGGPGKANEQWASSFGQWMTGDYVSGVLYGQSIGRRSMIGEDFNSSSDWQMFSSLTLGMPNMGGDSTAPAAVTNVVLIDNDNTNPGLDGRDITITWTPAPTADPSFERYEIYLLLATTTLNTETHTPIEILRVGQYQSSGVSNYTFTAPSFVTKSSANNNLVSGGSYKAYVIAVDTAGNKSGTAMSQNATLTGETYSADSDTNPPMIMHMSVWQAAYGQNITLITRAGDDRSLATTSGVQVVWATSTAPTTPDLVNNASTTDCTVLESGFYSCVISGGVNVLPTSTFVGYYLKATDGAATPNISYMSASPDADTSRNVTNVKANPFVISITATSTYTDADANADLAGYIYNSAGVALADAYVFVPGTASGYATTSIDGSFSIADNTLMSGSLPIVVFKLGYMEFFSNAFKGESTLAYYLNAGSSSMMIGGGAPPAGGYMEMPEVIWTNPAPGSGGCPTTGFAVSFGFSKSMNANTIQDNNTADAGSNIYLTSDGQNRISGAISYATSTNQGTFTVSSNTTLTANTEYMLVITQGVTDDTGNPIMGNQPNGSYVARFFTQGDINSYMTDQGYGDMAAGYGQGGMMTPPYIKGTTPQPGSFNVSNNTAVIIEFSEPMDSTTITSTNIKLRPVTNQTSWTLGDAVSATTSLDQNTQRIVTITPSQALATTSSWYVIQVTGGVRSAQGVWLGNPNTSGFQTIVFFESSFQLNTGNTSNDATAPTVLGTSPRNNDGISNTSYVDVGIPAIEIGFSEAMRPSTINTQNIKLKAGSTAITGNVSYDPMSNSAKFSSVNALSANTQYSLTVATATADLAGNNLAAVYNLIFKTGSADTVTPEVLYANGDDYTVAVTFSEPMNAAQKTDTTRWSTSVLNPANYFVNSATMPVGCTNNLWSCATTTLPYNTAGGNQLSGITGLTFTFDDAANTAYIKGFAFRQGGSPTDFMVFIDNVIDKSNNVITDSANRQGSATHRNAALSPLQNSSSTYGMLGPGGGGMMMMGPMGGGGPAAGGVQTGAGPSMDMGKMGMMMAGAMPMNMTAGQTSMYFVNIPLVKQVVDSQLIVLTFPAGFDVTNVIPDPYSPANSDMNDFGSGVITFDATYDGDGIAVNASARTITVKLDITSGTTNSTLGPEGFRDFIHFDLKGIVNSSIPQEFGTSGYTVDIKSKGPDGALLETIQTMPFYLNQGGANTLEGTIYMMTGDSQNYVQIQASETLNVFLGSPMTGPMENQATFSAGATSTTYTFSNLPSGEFYLFTDPMIKIIDNGGTSIEFDGMAMPEPISLTASTTKNITLKKLDNTAGAALTVTLKGNFSTGNATDSVDIFAYSPTGGHRAKMGISPNDDGATSTNGASYTFYLPQGQWQIGVGPAMPMGPMAGPVQMKDWMSPPMQSVSSDGATADPNTVTFNINAQSQSQIKGKVVDGNSNAIPDAEVWAYQPQGGFGNSRTKTDTVGVFTLKVGVTGSWSIGASKPGLPPTKELTVRVDTNVHNDDNNTTADVYFEGQLLTGIGLTYKIKKPSNTISGKVLNSAGTAVAYAPVWARNTSGSGNSSTMTDSSGSYILYVENGTWQIEADAPSIGWMQYELPVTINNSSQSNINIRPAAGTSFYTISGNVTIDGTVQRWIPIRAVLYDTSGNYMGREYSGNTDSNGNYSISVPAGIYRVDIWTSAYGEVAANNLDGDVTPNEAVDDDFANNPANVDMRTANKSNVDILINAGSLINVTMNFNNGSSTQTGLVRIEQVDVSGTYPKPTGYNKSIKLSTLSASSTVQLQQDSYYFFNLDVPGLGFYIPDASDRDPTKDCIQATTSNRAVNFTLPDLTGTSMVTISGTVKDNSANTLSNAWVFVSNPDNFYNQGVQSSDGSFSFIVPKLSSGSYKVGANKPGYSSTRPNSVTGATSTSNNIVTLNSAAYTISGSVRDISNATITSAGWVWGEEVTTREQVGSPLAADGTYILAVPNSTTWKIFAHADGYSEWRYINTATGDSVTISGSSQSSINITLTADSSWTVRAKTKPMTPSQGGTVDDTTQSTTTGKTVGTGVKITVPPNALGSGDSSGQMEVTQTTQGRTNTKTPIDSFDISATDNSGAAISRLNDDVDVEKVIYKEDVNDLALTDKSKLKGLTLSYYDSANKDWAQIPTVESAYYKGTATDTEWTLYPNSGSNSSMDSFIDNVMNTTTPAVTYADYKLVLQGSTDHFTVYGATMPTDLVKPAPPTGAPTQSAGSGTSITISWTAVTLNEDNTAITDILGYQIYRSADDVTYTQVSTTTASSTTSYIDTTTSDWTSYYYKVTASDDGGNESAVASSTALQVCSNKTLTNGTVSSACAITCNSGYTASGHSCVVSIPSSPGAGSSYTYTPATTPITTTGQVTATADAGGKTTVTSVENTTASVELPANAVSANTAVTITPVAKTAAEITSAVASAPTGKNIVGGYVYNYSAAVGTAAVSAFSQTVTLTFTYTDSQIAGLNESSLRVYYWDSAVSEWVAMTTSVNTQTNTITCSTTHFTYFAIMGEEQTGTATTTPAAATTTPATTKPINEMTAAELQAEIARILGLISQLQIQLTELFGGGAISGIPSSFSFKATLKYKQSSIDVKYMQIVLNSDPTTRLAETGVGSLGKETNYFGDLTKTALIKFQERYASEILTPWKLDKGTGLVGSTTRAKLNELIGK